MGRPKGSKNKKQENSIPLTADYFKEDYERLKKKYANDSPFWTTVMSMPTFEWVKKVENWCTQRGWNPDELLEKIEQLEKGSYHTTVESLLLGQDKPNTAPEPEKGAHTYKNQKEGQEGAETEFKKQFTNINALGSPEDIQKVGEIMKQQEAQLVLEIVTKKLTPQSKPKELSPFLKKLQESKNGQK